MSAPTNWALAGRRPPGGTEPGLPPLATQARNALGAAARTVRRVVAGEPVLATAEVQALRERICGTCPKRRSDGRCAACGCFLRLKLASASEACPEGKW